MVHNHDSANYKTSTTCSKDDTNIIPTCYFYMPSGEQVSYCAHAAMGAAYILHTRQHSRQTKETQSTGEILFQTAQGVQTKDLIQGNDVVELGIPKQLQFQEQMVDAKVVMPMLISMLIVIQRMIQDAMQDAGPCSIPVWHGIKHSFQFRPWSNSMRHVIRGIP